MATDLSNEEALKDLARLADKGATWTELSKCNGLIQYVARYIPGLVKIEPHGQTRALRAVLREALARNWEVLGNVDAHKWRSPHIREAAEVAAAGELIALPDPKFRVQASAKPSTDEKPHRQRRTKGKTYRQHRAGARLIPPIDAVRSVLRREPELLKALLLAIGVHLTDKRNARGIAEHFGIEVLAEQLKPTSDAGTSSLPASFSGKELDVVGSLLRSANDDPVTKTIFQRIAESAGHSTNDDWRLGLESHYRLLDRVISLEARLEAVVKEKGRDSRPWRPKSLAQARLCNAEMERVHSALRLLILQHGTIYVFNDELEKELGEAIYRLYVYSPFETFGFPHEEPPKDAWLSRIRARDKIDPRERKDAIPSWPAVEEIDWQWSDLLLSCYGMDEYDWEQDDCLVHGLIYECQQYRKAARQLLIKQISSEVVPTQPST